MVPKPIWNRNSLDIPPMNNNYQQTSQTWGSSCKEKNVCFTHNCVLMPYFKLATILHLIFITYNLYLFRYQFTFNLYSKDFANLLGCCVIDFVVDSKENLVGIWGQALDGRDGLWVGIWVVDVVSHSGLVSGWVVVLGDGTLVFPLDGGWDGNWVFVWPVDPGDVVGNSVSAGCLLGRSEDISVLGCLDDRCVGCSVVEMNSPTRRKKTLAIAACEPKTAFIPIKAISSNPFGSFSFHTLFLSS